MRATRAVALASWSSRAPGRRTRSALGTPPAPCTITAPCARSSCPSPLTRSPNPRTLSWRSCGVVSAACHRAGTSCAKRWSASRSRDVNAGGRSRRNRADASGRCCASPSAASQRRSRARATRRFAGATASYGRAARWALERARSSRWGPWASQRARAARSACSAATRNSHDAGWSPCRIGVATQRSRHAPARLRHPGAPSSIVARRHVERR